MSASLDRDLQQLVDQVKTAPQISATFKALLVLLDHAPDRDVVINALSQIEPGDVADLTLRERAANLLERADANALHHSWHVADALEANNVVVLRDDRPPPSPTRPENELTFDDIGGLETVKKQVRRKIIAPFQGKKALFERFKRKAGGGVLMYGPPGCGKTMLARALANECNARFINIRASDILDQYVGNAEKRIARTFREARATRPVVLFFDEIEALAQRRELDNSTRINTTISALLTEMDGFESDSDGILFLGATNVPWSLDSAFRRPGRFDRTIFVPPPDRIARKFILSCLLRDRPTVPDVKLDLIVERTSGYSGADLSALVDASIDIAIDESASANDFEPLNNVHFAEALKDVRSSTGEWLAQARGFADYANESGMYDDLAGFLKKYAR